jgi:tetratricopeptide (TPR) repeat protein
MRLPTVEDIERSDYDILVAYCKELGLSHNGNESDLKQQLKDYLNEGGSMEKGKTPEVKDAGPPSLERAALLIKLNMPEKALEILRKIKKEDKYYWLELGNCYLLMDKPQDALTCYDHAIELDGEFKKAIIAKQNLLSDLFRYEEALKTNLSIPDDMQTLFVRILLLQNSGKLLEALKYCDQVLQEKELEHLYNLKGLILMKFEKFENALECFEHALAINDHFPEAWNNKGVCLLKLNLKKEADEALQTALSLKSDYATAWSNRAMIARQSRNTDKAIRFLKLSLEYMPTSEGWNTLGQIYLKRNKLKTASKCFNKALELDTTNSEGWNNKGLLLEKRKNYKGALKCFEKALILKPDFAEAEKSKARAKGKLNTKA